MCAGESENPARRSRMGRLRLTKAILLLACTVVAGVGGCGPAGRTVEVSVAVDFGAAGRPPVERTVAVPERGTVFEALRAAFPVATSGR